ncbi:MAG TPA: 50S ribosomal protein L10 [Coxiellaceae bacterium]|nr:50S ribosomal protein L10 [Coxiellaceae bacterium]
MALTLDAKKAIVEELTAVVSRSTSVLAAEYRGLTVSQMTELRASARNANVAMRVVKNTLARRLLKDTEYACLANALTGPLVLLFSQDAPGAAARCVQDFKKKTEIEVRAIALGGQLLGPERLKSVAELPSRNEAIASLMMVMQGPATKLVRTLAETYAQMVRVMGAIRDQKQAAG